MTIRCGSGASRAAVTARAVREAADAALSALRAQRADVCPDVTLVFASPDHPQAEVLRELASLVSGDVIAASTAGELTERGSTRGGVAIMCIAWDGEAVHTLSPVRPLEDPVALADAIANDARTNWDAGGRAGHIRTLTALIAHGLGSGLESLVAAFRKETPSRHLIVGGGAADDGRLKTSWVGTGVDAIEGGAAALHVSSNRPFGIGIGHGAVACSPRMTVTKARDNVVLELDGEPAFEVYRRHAEAHGVALEGDAIGPYLVANELGIFFFDDIVRIRAGTAVTPEGGIFCAGEVPESAVVAIVRGTPDAVVEAARNAVASALRGAGGTCAGLLVFSCVTRGLAMGDEYEREVDALRAAVPPGTPIAGFLSYGEVAQVKGKLDGLHNNTIVVLAIPG